jgi:hypothetical protein
MEAKEAFHTKKDGSERVALMTSTTVLDREMPERDPLVNDK